MTMTEHTEGPASFSIRAFDLLWNGTRLDTVLDGSLRHDEHIHHGE